MNTPVEGMVLVICTNEQCGLVIEVVFELGMIIFGICLTYQGSIHLNILFILF